MRNQLQKDKDNKRLASFIVIVAILFSILLIRLFYLQVIKGQSYLEQATNNSIKTQSVPTLRGNIYDRNGIILATNISSYMLVLNNVTPITSQMYKILLDNKDNDEIVIPSNISKKIKEKIITIHTNIKDLRKYTQLSYQEILKKLYSEVSYGISNQITIDKNISEEVAIKSIENIKNPNIDILEYDKRYYPLNNIASHVIGNVKDISTSEYQELKNNGYTKRDIVGKKGIEKEYDKELKGEYGIQYIETDARGRILDVISETNSKKGNDLYLNIDSNLQAYMTEQFHNKFGAFIAMEAKTGKIITLVSSPEIDLNLLSSKISEKDWNNILSNPEKPLINKAISGLYPPGSTFKIVTGTALLENGISKDKTINSTGSFKYSDNIYRDSHRNGHGLTNFNKSIEESVNTYYYELINEIPLEAFINTAKEFNLGQKTGIDIPYELSGLLPTPEWKESRFTTRQTKMWLPGDSINMSIGQGYLLVTPIQMLMVYQAIANNGVMLKPKLLDKIKLSDGTIVENKTEEIRKLNIKKSTLETIQNALRLPVKGKNGTAKILNLPYVDVSAKTGTAQNYSTEDHSWMVGYFPSKNPEIVFVSLVTEGGYGAVEAGAKAKKFIEKYYNKEEVTFIGK